jgi:hypothetical protein
MKAKGLGCLITVGVFLFLGLMLGCCAPITLRLTAPVACPDGYARSAVVVETTNPEPGTTNFNPDLYCVDKTGVAVRASWLVGVATLAVECALLAAVAGVLFAGWARFGPDKKRSRGGAS